MDAIETKPTATPVEKIRDRINRRLKSCELIIASYQVSKDFVTSNLERFERLGVEPEILGGVIDINYPTREQTVTLLMEFPGRWDKQQGGPGTITYRQEINEQLTLRLYCAPPPPSCKIITERVLVPAKTIPEHFEEQTRLECKPEVGEE